jgi:hypothetical protein
MGVGDPDADRRARLLIYRAVEGVTLGILFTPTMAHASAAAGLLRSCCRLSKCVRLALCPYLDYIYI